MEKLNINEAITLLRLHEGSLDFINVEPDDYNTQNALISLAEKKLIDAYAIVDPLTELGVAKVNSMLSYGINYNRHFERLSINAKKAAFLALINSGYEPRGLMSMLVRKLKENTFQELKKAVHGRKNISLGTNKRRSV